MNLESLIKPDSVLCNVSARSKKHCLEILSELLTRSNPDIASEEVFAKLVERERLGCTCLDKGIAFPHCRISGLTTSCAALMKLVEPVDFDSVDGEPVDLIFGLMVPEDLSVTDYSDIESLSSLLRDRTLCASLRATTNSKGLSDALLTAGITPIEKLKTA
ncbi:MAG: PTS sugar transporter subunit IIA [Proteobacteria bacterium]|nr:PTS sugar transporter subunit IIA [Pseudomonadota bacterium]MDA0992840.1 PTS sugar transporter subunit IIA [Pseudomonadota bacterium]